jgi:hypothetical protein
MNIGGRGTDIARYTEIMSRYTPNSSDNLVAESGGQRHSILLEVGRKRRGVSQRRLGGKYE